MELIFKTQGMGNMLYNIQRFLKRPFLKSILVFLLALTFVSGSVEKMVTFKTEIPLQFLGHDAGSLFLAFNKVMCNKNGYVNSYGFNAFKDKLFQQTTEPLLNPILKAININNLSEYCSSLKMPFVNSENTLGWIMLPIFKIYPSISFQGLVFILFMIQIIMLWFFFYYLTSIGISSIYIFVLSVVSISITSTQMPYLIFSQYPLLLPGVLVLISLLGFSIQYQWYQRPLVHTAFSCLIGFYLFFIYNLRTSYILPAFGVLTLYYLFLFYSKKEFGLKNIVNAIYPFLLIMISSLSCNIIMQKLFLPTEINKDNAEYQRSHPIAHPLILGLAVPSNEFAKKQGIEWSDSVGLRIALNMDPNVRYLTPKYGTVLLSYYRSLWKNFPKDMLQLYVKKFESVGKNFAIDLMIARSMYPLGTLNGLMTIFIQLLLLGLLVKNRNKLSPGIVFGLSSLSLAGMALYLESGIIYSVYEPRYHAFLTFWIVCLNLAVLNLIFYVPSVFLLKLRNTWWLPLSISNKEVC